MELSFFIDNLQPISIHGMSRVESNLSNLSADERKDGDNINDSES